MACLSADGQKRAHCEMVAGCVTLDIWVVLSLPLFPFRHCCSERAARSANGRRRGRSAPRLLAAAYASIRPAASRSDEPGRDRAFFDKGSPDLEGQLEQRDALVNYRARPGRRDLARRRELDQLRDGSPDPPGRPTRTSRSPPVTRRAARPGATRPVSRCRAEVPRRKRAS